MEKSLIIITGLNEKFNQRVASILCERLAMYLLDLSKLMEFELADKDDIVSKCGVDYFEKLENKLIKSVSNYENTVALVSYDMLTYKENFKFFSKSAYIFYLRFDNKNIKKDKDVNIINKIAYEERDKVLIKVCPFVVTLKTFNLVNAVEIILEQLKEVAL